MTEDPSFLTRLLEWESLISIGTIFVLLGFSGFFSGSETALTAASRGRLHKLADDGNKRAHTVLHLLEDRERLIGGILLGNNLVNILASAIATSLFLRLFGDAGVAAATAVMTALVLVLAEVLPKTYAILHTDRMAMVVAPIIRLFVSVFGPVVAVVQILVRGTLRLFGAKIDAGSEVLSVHDELRGTIVMHDAEMGSAPPRTAPQGARPGLESDLQMVGGVLDLRDLEVSEVMVHRQSITMVDGGQPWAVIVDQVLNAPHTRIPIWRDNPENIIGVLHAKDLLRALGRVEWQVDKLDLDTILRPPWFVPETTELQAQLAAFLQKDSHFALVVDEYGALMGLITLEDIIEEIVGDIRDEHDENVTGVRPQPDGAYNIDGTVAIRDLNRAMRWKLPDDEATTIAGLVIHEAQTIPNPGQVFTFHGFEFEILRRWRNQITAVRVTPPPHLRGRRAVRVVPKVPVPSGKP